MALLKRKKPELVYHKGCEKCTKKCVYNKPVTTKEKNLQTRINKYNCNSSL